jgi:GntR family transcriptional regulator, transcriptional repressor for pyruvate dehydrogenase complex
VNSFGQSSPEKIFRPARSRRTFEDATEQIVDAIKAGDLQVGHRLPSERMLSAQMQISRPTLRQAIRLLSEAGIIEVKPGPGGGMIVRSDNIPPDLIDSRGHVDLRIGQVASVLEARRLVEPNVAQLAAARATDADIDSMQQIIELQRVAQDDEHRFLELDVRFHLAIARATHNETVITMMRPLLRQLEIARRRMLQGDEDAELTLEIHERTLAAIVSGDPATIEQVMDEHLSWLEERWEKETGRLRLRKTPEFLLPFGERSASRARRAR